MTMWWPMGACIHCGAPIFTSDEPVEGQSCLDCIFDGTTETFKQTETPEGETMTEIIHNVSDGRHGWIGAWETEPLDLAKLTEADIGRTVIYRDHGRAEAGTLTSRRGGVVFARYSRGDTAAGANASDLVFGICRADSHPDTPPA